LPCSKLFYFHLQQKCRLCNWWVMRDLNPRHSPCKGDALPTELITRNAERGAFYRFRYPCQQVTDNYHQNQQISCYFLLAGVRERTIPVIRQFRLFQCSNSLQIDSIEQSLGLRFHKRVKRLLCQLPCLPIIQIKRLMIMP
jgi:hypothetical protein